MSMKNVARSSIPRQREQVRENVGFWTDLPSNQVVRLTGASAAAVEATLEPPQLGAPAVVAFYPGRETDPAKVAASILAELEKTAIQMFPSWLPGAEGIDGPGGANVAAVRALANELAARTTHFGPFLEDLAETALIRRAKRTKRPSGEIRAVGLARVIAASYDRQHVALLVHLPPDFTADEEEALVAAAEWLASNGHLSVWLVGGSLRTIDRVRQHGVVLPGEERSGVTDLSAGPVITGPAVIYPPIAGRPHPASAAEQRLESALLLCDWASGREWNQVYPGHPLAIAIRLDLWWRTERCIVEVDGDDHRGRFKFGYDRRRDVELQQANQAVLRFTNDEIFCDLKSVLHRIQKFLQKQRNKKLGAIPT